MANRRGKICRFTPYPKEEKKPDLEKEKTRLDIEILKSMRYKFKLKSMRYKFKGDNELKFHFDKIITKLIKSI